MLLFESALREKACLARSLPHILRRRAAEALVPHDARPLAPTLPVAVNIACRQIVADAPLPQLIANLQRTVPSGDPLQDEIFSESLLGQEILGLERVQRLADERLRESPRDELATELDACVLATRE